MVAVAGTSTSDGWGAWGGLDDLRPARWGPPGRCVIVAAHPGDEVLGLGGTIQTLVTGGHAVEVVTMTGDPADARRALDLLGVGPIPVVSLAETDGTPGTGNDTEVGTESSGAAGRAARLAQHLAGASWCVSTWRNDGQPDHEQAGATARQAAEAAGVPLAEYFVHTWEWAQPGDERVPWSDARRSAFDARVLARKEAALTRYRTTRAHSTGGVPAGDGGHVRLTPELRARLLQSFEVVLQPSLAPPTYRG